MSVQTLNNVIGTVRDVYEEIAEIIKGREDYVYPIGAGSCSYGDGSAGCSYVRDGEPSCLVGVYLAAKGVPIESLHKADVGPDFGEPEALLPRLVQEGHLTCTSDNDLLLVGQYLAGVQGLQDTGTPWGTAALISLPQEEE